MCFYSSIAAAMVKESSWQNITTPVLGIFLVMSQVACSGARPRVEAPPTPTPQVPSAPILEHPMAFSLSDHPTEVRKLWTQKISGLLTDLNVSRDGSAILVATAPNPEVEGSGFKHHLARYNRHGKLLWKNELKGAVKSQSLTDDGKLAIVSTYDNEIFALDSRGKTVWTMEGTCKPIPLHDKFLCYHDDDAEPDVAFDVFTNKGHKTVLYPITRDVLAVKVSSDERYTVVALTDGQVVLFDPDFRSIWQKKVDGELVDISVSSGENPKVAALANYIISPDSKGVTSQKTVVFDRQGNRLAEAIHTHHVEQLEIAPDGSGLAVYGNSAQGQYLGYFGMPIPTGSDKLPQRLAEKWRRGDARAADYSSSIIVTRDLVILGFEDIGLTARHSHLLSFDFAGKLKWNIPLVTEEGAYLYAHGYAQESSLLAVGTDDSLLSAFQLKDSD